MENSIRKQRVIGEILAIFNVEGRNITLIAGFDSDIFNALLTLEPLSRVAV